MSLNLTTIVGVIALLVMLFNLFSVVSLRKQIPGGMIGKRWGMMIWLVALFTAGYGILPFVSALSVDMLRLIVSLIFFFGALYVMITLRLIASVIRELMS